MASSRPGGAGGALRLLRGRLCIARVLAYRFCIGCAEHVYGACCAAARCAQEAMRETPSEVVFVFEMDAALHFLLSLIALLPFCITGKAVAGLPSALASGVYATIYVTDSEEARRWRSRYLKGLRRLFPGHLTTFLGVAFVSTTMLLLTAGHILEGPPLCFMACDECAKQWKKAIPLPPGSGAGDGRCGVLNGVGLYATLRLAQSATFAFLSIFGAIVTCNAWSLSLAEMERRRETESWLKGCEGGVAFALREELIFKTGRSGSPTPLFCDRSFSLLGACAAILFSSLAHRRWLQLRFLGNEAVAVSALHAIVVLASTACAHFAFFGRLAALYQRNFDRVQHLTAQLREVICTVQEVEERDGGLSGEDLESQVAAGQVSMMVDRRESFVEAGEAGGSPLVAPAIVMDGAAAGASKSSADLQELAVLPVAHRIYQHAERIRDQQRIEHWWRQRLFVFFTDMELDYRMAGLGVLASFITAVVAAAVVLQALWMRGVPALGAAPGIHCLCAGGYMTVCIIKLLDIAVCTYEEQQSHARFLSTHRDYLRQRNAYSLLGDSIDKKVVEIRESDPLPRIVGVPISPKAFDSVKKGARAFVLFAGAFVIYDYFETLHVFYRLPDLLPREAEQALLFGEPDFLKG